jgi:methyltransferase (TIGR00027 family)
VERGDVPRTGVGARRAAQSTAEAFASLRAAGARERDPRVRSRDHLAERLLRFSPRLSAIAKVPLLRGLTARVAEWVAPGAYFYELARVKHIDGLLEEEMASHPRQLVILGAGFDSRAYRFEELLRDVRVFEVDRPATSALKRRRVAAVLGGLPSHVSYVEADFDTDDLATKLAEAGYDPDARTMFVWSGVSMFLTARGVDALLEFVREHAAAGSSIAFDYHYAAFIEQRRRDFHGGEQARRRAAGMGEPFVFGIEEGEVGRFLEERGFVLESDVGPAELERRYLVRTDGRLRGRPLGFISIAYARLPASPAGTRA